MKTSRRASIKQAATATTTSVADATLPADTASLVTGRGLTQFKWSKAPCRFCDTGCGIEVVVKDNRVMVIQGNPRTEINRGLNYVEGYFLPKIIYGKDRLTQPLLHMTNGKCDKNGEFTPTTRDRAFDEVAVQSKRVIKGKDPTTVGMLGSGRWTIFEGYTAVKLMKAGFRSNNLDPNAHHCMTSAVTNFIRTFGMDEPMGCCDDFEVTGAFVLWGSNMAEIHPILWSRMADRRLSVPKTRIVVLSASTHRSFDPADIPIVFTPQADLVMLNYIANYIITSKKVNMDFVNKHTVPKQDVADIGYGPWPNNPLQKTARNTDRAGDSKPTSFGEFAKFVSTYDLDYITKLTSPDKSEEKEFKQRFQKLTELCADPKIKAASLQTTGFN